MERATTGESAARCWACGTAMAAADRFCARCGAGVLLQLRPHTARRKRKLARGVAAGMFLVGLAIVLFALVHRDPADLILVVGFALPLCGAGALGWRTV